MSTSPRHWRLTFAINTALAVAILLGGYYVFLRPLQADVATPPQGTSNPPATTAPSATTLNYRGINQIRGILCLTHQDLAAMGCSSAQTQAVLAALQTSYQANRTAWATASTQKARAKQGLQEATRLINMGPSDDSVVASLQTLEAQVSAAETQRQQVLVSMSSPISGQLNSTQAAMRATAQANVTAGAPDRYRYVPNLSATQIMQLKSFLRQASQPNSNLAASEATVLSTDQLAAAQAAVVNAKQYGTGVSQAEAILFPQPIRKAPKPATTAPAVQ